MHASQTLPHANSLPAFPFRALPSATDPGCRRGGEESAPRKELGGDESMTPPADPSAASRLCAACGLCCNGVLFHRVHVGPQDSAPALAALGLKLKRKNGRDYILQPCPAHQGSHCTVYLQRPERCRLFACRQLRRVTAGEITEAAALEKIREARQRVAHLDGLSRRADGSLRRGPLAQRCETTLAEPFDATTHPELVAQRMELARALAELDAMLDADFRLPTGAAGPEAQRGATEAPAAAD